MNENATRGAQAATGPMAADVAVGSQLAQAKDHPAVRALGAFSEVADQPPLAALCGAVLVYGVLADDRRAARAGGGMLAALVVATLAKGVLKRLVSRTRPHLLLDEGRHEVEPLGPDSGPWHSFPSGHTAGAVAVARALGRVYPEGRRVVYGGAALVALAQVPRGAHYPADVAAGALIGLAAEAAVEQALGRLRRELAASVPRAAFEARAGGRRRR